ncbi:MAG: hypothetical protein ACM3ZE_18495 [Myxococcales bacterium]
MENGTGLVATGGGALGSGALGLSGLVLGVDLVCSGAALARLLPNGNPS